MKRCTKCGEDKDETEFRVRTEKRLDSVCRPCHREYHRRWWHENKDKIRAYNNTDKVKAARKRYAQSEKGKAVQARKYQKHKTTEKYERAVQSRKADGRRSEVLRRYSESEKGVLTYARHRAKSIMDDPIQPLIEVIALRTKIRRLTHEQHY